MINAIVKPIINISRSAVLDFYSVTALLITDAKKFSKLFTPLHLWRGFFASFDLQHINNPGYNKDRGPVPFPASAFTWISNNHIPALIRTNKRTECHPERSEGSQRNCLALTALAASLFFL